MNQCSRLRDLYNFLMLFFYIFVQTNDRILIRVIYPDPITGFFLDSEPPYNWIHCH